MRFGLAACRVVETPPSAIGARGSGDLGSSSKGVGAAVAGVALAGAGAAGAAVASGLASQNFDSTARSDYQPAVASTLPVAWQFGDDYKPGFVTSFPFVEKVREKKAATTAEAEGIKPPKQYYPKKKLESYDPFASA